MSYGEDHATNLFSPSALNETVRVCALRIAHPRSAAWVRIAAPIRAAKMVLAFAPVDAAATEGALPAVERLELDTTLCQDVTPLHSQMDKFAAPAQ